MSDEHTLELGQDFDGDDWIAVCACGRWESKPCAAEMDAVDAWENHCDVVFMKATQGSEWSL